MLFLKAFYILILWDVNTDAKKKLYKGELEMTNYTEVKQSAKTFEISHTYVRMVRNLSYEPPQH